MMYACAVKARAPRLTLKPKDIYYMICDRLNERGATAKRTQCKQMETKPSLPLIKVFFRLEVYAQKNKVKAHTKRKVSFFEK